MENVTLLSLEMFSYLKVIYFKTTLFLNDIFEIYCENLQQKN